MSVVYNRFSGRAAFTMLLLEEAQHFHSGAQGFWYFGDLSCRVGFFGLADLQKQVTRLRDSPLYKKLS